MHDQSLTEVKLESCREKELLLVRMQKMQDSHECEKKQWESRVIDVNGKVDEKARL